MTGSNGIAGIFKPQAGQTISCSGSGWGVNEGFSTVDASGVVFTRVRFSWSGVRCDSGWVKGVSAGCTWYGSDPPITASASSGFYLVAGGSAGGSCTEY